ncbi:MAG: hypothetical protein EAX95_13680 [Candidatus Thorarchaeota archaeon]|nr:hypothetical protein [Candidatus Thorarchaeota archaeon]
MQQRRVDKLGKRIDYGSPLRKHVKRYNLHDKLASILSLLGTDAQQVVEWAEKEARRNIQTEAKPKDADLGKEVFNLLGYTAAIRLVQINHKKGRLTTKSEVKKRTGQRVEMPVLYQEAGLRHPQEARNLRHNIFHEAFLAYVTHLFPDVATNVPNTGEGLTPDLMVYHQNPDWTISVEYKGYRSITLLSESEVLKGMRYQEAYGTAWLVTSSVKSVRETFGPNLNSTAIVEQGLERLARIAKRRAYTEEQKENRGIARKGLTHLQKHEDAELKCKLISAEELLESCRAGKPLKGLAITTGMEFVQMLTGEGFDEHADNVLRIMKTPARKVHSDSVTSVRLIG